MSHGAIQKIKVASFFGTRLLGAYKQKWVHYSKTVGLSSLC